MTGADVKVEKCDYTHHKKEILAMVGKPIHVVLALQEIHSCSLIFYTQLVILFLRMGAIFAISYFNIILGWELTSQKKKKKNLECHL